jgi:hypothetical protein
MSKSFSIGYCVSAYVIDDFEKEIANLEKKFHNPGDHEDHENHEVKEKCDHARNALQVQFEAKRPSEAKDYLRRFSQRNQCL